MKNKYVQNICHILVVLISFYAWNFDRLIFSGEYNFIRTAIGALGFAYLPYLLLINNSFAADEIEKGRTLSK